jgi:hypothetical protein
VGSQHSRASPRFVTACHIRFRSMDSPHDGPLRKKHQRYVGAKPFQNGQYDYEKTDIDAKDQEYYDELKLRSTKLILDRFGSEFPSCVQLINPGVSIRPL